MDERRRQQPDAVLDLAGDGFGKDGDLLARPLANPVPQPAIASEVMVTREQPPAAVELAHARDRLDDRPVVRTLGVENVAGDNDMLGALFGGETSERFDRVEARLG